jgi:RNA polymerase sigma factor (sigma-70 family)
MAKKATHCQRSYPDTTCPLDPSPATIKILYVQFQFMIKRLARNLSWDTESFKELLQEGTIAFIQALPNFNPNAGAKVSTFMYSRIQGAMLHWRRKELSASGCYGPKRRGRNISIFEPVPTMGNESGKGICVGDLIEDENSSLSPFQQAHRSLLRDLVDRALMDLPVRQREAIRLLFWEDESPSDIAVSLGVSRPRVSILIRKALSHLRTGLAAAA